MPDRLNTLESSMSQNIKHKMSELESELEKKKKEEKKIKGGNTSWKTPFVILFLLIVGSLIGAYSFYRNLVKKMHLP